MTKRARSVEPVRGEEHDLAVRAQARAARPSAANQSQRSNVAVMPALQGQRAERQRAGQPVQLGVVAALLDRLDLHGHLEAVAFGEGGVADPRWSTSGTRISTAKLNPVNGCVPVSGDRHQASSSVKPCSPAWTSRTSTNSIGYDGRELQLDDQPARLDALRRVGRTADLDPEGLFRRPAGEGAATGTGKPAALRNPARPRGETSGRWARRRTARPRAAATRRISDISRRTLIGRTSGSVVKVSSARQTKPAGVWRRALTWASCSTGNHRSLSRRRSATTSVNRSLAGATQAPRVKARRAMMPVTAPSGGDQVTPVAASRTAPTHGMVQRAEAERPALGEPQRRDRRAHVVGGAQPGGVRDGVGRAVVLGQREDRQQVAARGAHPQQRAMNRQQVGRVAVGSHDEHPGATVAHRCSVGPCGVQRPGFGAYPVEPRLATPAVERVLHLGPEIDLPGPGPAPGVGRELEPVRGGLRDRVPAQRHRSVRAAFDGQLGCRSELGRPAVHERRPTAARVRRLRGIGRRRLRRGRGRLAVPGPLGRIRGTDHGDLVDVQQRVHTGQPPRRRRLPAQIVGGREHGLDARFPKPRVDEERGVEGAEAVPLERRAVADHRRCEGGGDDTDVHGVVDGVGDRSRQREPWAADLGPQAGRGPAQRLAGREVLLVGGQVAEIARVSRDESEVGQHPALPGPVANPELQAEPFDGVLGPQHRPGGAGADLLRARRVDPQRPARVDLDPLPGRLDRAVVGGGDRTDRQIAGPAVRRVDPEQVADQDRSCDRARSAGSGRRAARGGSARPGRWSARLRRTACRTSCRPRASTVRRPTIRRRRPEPGPARDAGPARPPRRGRDRGRGRLPGRCGPVGRRRRSRRAPRRRAAPRRTGPDLRPRPAAAGRRTPTRSRRRQSPARARRRARPRRSRRNRRRPSAAEHAAHRRRDAVERDPGQRAGGGDQGQNSASSRS